MAVVLALPRLFDAVVARFTAESTAVANVFGWRAPDQKETRGPRVAWVPGDDGGALGELVQPKKQALLEQGRPLANLEELFHVVIVSADTTAPENERAQYQALRELFDAWWRAVHLAAHGTVRIVSAEWVIDRKVRRHGAAIVVTCSIDAVIPDAPYEKAPVDTAAEIDVEELDVTEHQSIEAGGP